MGNNNWKQSNNNHNKNGNNFAKQNYGNGNYGGSNHNRNNDNQVVIKKIDEPLSIHYKNKSDLYLPDGIAQKKAVEFKRIPAHQLRKILNQSKKCKLEIEKSKENFSTARNQLYSVLPLAAYNAGRDKNLKCLYTFLVENLNENSITKAEDILIFDELFTSIIAYHKLAGGK